MSDFTARLEARNPASDREDAATITVTMAARRGGPSPAMAGS